MARFSLREQESSATTVPASFSPSIRTSRLLNQFMKRKSPGKWDIHSTLSYVQGFYPICPITLLADHKSQQHKHKKDYQFTTQALQSITSPSVIKQKDMDNLGTFMQRVQSYSKLVKAAKSPPHSFIDLSERLKQIQEKSTFSSIIHHLATVQRNVPYFFLSLYTYAAAKQIALSIKAALTENTIKQHKALVDSAKSRISFLFSILSIIKLNNSNLYFKKSHKDCMILCIGLYDRLVKYAYKNFLCFSDFV